MSDEHDSWFKDAFDVDLGQAVQGLKDEASAVVDQVSSTVTQVVQGVQGAVEGVLDEATGAAAGIAKKVAGAVSPAGAGGASGASGANGGIGSFPLGGSVGRGGKNAANDVRAVQTALGIAADGQCGGQTIAAIEAFQRTTMGVAQPDGRVDAGGSTERELTGDGGKSPEPLPPVGDVAGGPFGALQAGAKALAGAGSGAAVGVVGTATALATGVVAAAGSALSGDGGAEGLFASDVDVRQATPGDASSALPLMAAMGSPVPLPMPDPEGPVSGVRLIEKGAKAVGEAAVGIGAGALAVGLAAGAAVLTWSSKTAPPWMDEMNPKTGKPYKDEDEWKAVKERQEKQQRGGGRQPHSGPLVARMIQTPNRKRRPARRCFQPSRSVRLL